MGFFRKDRKVFGMSFFARMMVAVLVVVIVGVSGSLLYSLELTPYEDLIIGNFTADYDGRIPYGSKTFLFRGNNSDHSSEYRMTHNDGTGNFNIYYNAYAYNDGSSKHTYVKPGGAYHIVTNVANGDIRYMLAEYGTPGQEILWNDSLYLKNNGNVGIGTTNPNYKLDILAPLAQCFSIGYGGDSGRISTSYLDAGPALIIFDKDDTCSIRFRQGDNEQEPTHEASIFGKNGNIGIGVSPPSSSKLYVDGRITGSQYACTSDSRYKKNITIYRNALEKVLGLRGVTFFWNAEKYKDRKFGKEKQIGFIAQEVEKVIPEIVYTDDRGFKTMSYDRLTAVLVEAVKELKAEKDGEIAKSNEKIAALEIIEKEKDIRIAKLEEENETLKADNAELKQKLAKLDSVIDRLVSLERKMEKQEGLSLAER